MGGNAVLGPVLGQGRGDDCLISLSVNGCGIGCCDRSGGGVRYLFGCRRRRCCAQGVDLVLHRCDGFFERGNLEGQLAGAAQG